MKVFSVKKFRKEMIEKGRSEEDITLACNMWANSCDGKTKKELLEEGIRISKVWFVNKNKEVKHGSKK